MGKKIHELDALANGDIALATTLLAAKATGVSDAGKITLEQLFTKDPAAARAALGIPFPLVQRLYAVSGTEAQVNGNGFGHDNTIPQNNEGAAYGLDVPITPKHASNIILLDVELNCSSGAAATVQVGLFVDNVANALRAWGVTIPNADYQHTYRMRHFVVAGSTDLRTYKVRVGSSGNVFINRTNTQADLYNTVVTSSLLVEEFLPAS